MRRQQVRRTSAKRCLGFAALVALVIWAIRARRRLPHLLPPNHGTASEAKGPEKTEPRVESVAQRHAPSFPDAQELVAQHARRLTALEALSIPVGVPLVAPGVVLGLAGAFPARQPMLGWGLLAVSLIELGACVYDVAVRRSRPAWRDYKKFPRQTLVLTALMTSSAATLAALLSLWSRDRPWGLIGLAMIAFGSVLAGFGWLRIYWPIARRIAPELRLMISRDRSRTWITPAKEAMHDLSDMFLGFAIAGIVYVAAFLPIVFAVANGRGQPLMDVLLLSEARELVNGPVLVSGWAALWRSADWAVLGPMALMYGLVGLVSGLFFFVHHAMREPLWKLLAIASGLGIAYELTWLCSLALGQATTADALPGVAYGFGYVVLLHYGLWTVKSVIPRLGMQEKYSFVIDGFQALGASWIITRAAGASSELFTGAMFYALFLAATGLYEVITRPFRSLDEESDGDTPVGLRGRWVHVDWSVARLSAIVSVVFPVFAYGITRWLLG